MPRPNDPVLEPNLGLYLGAARLTAPSRALLQGNNFRIFQGKIVRDNLGWSTFPEGETAINLDNNPVMLVDEFQPRGGTKVTIFGTTEDLYALNAGGTAVAFITPRYETGTVAVTNGDATVTGTGTSWNANLKAGDKIHIGASGQTDPSETWYTIDSITSDTELELTEVYPGVNDSGLSYTGRKLFTGDILDFWRTEPFFSGTSLGEGSDGDRWYATNGVDAVVAWDGTTDDVYFPGTGLDTCTFLRAFKGVMIYGAPTVSGDLRSFSVRVSAPNQPENTATAGAVELVVHQRDDPLVACHIIGDLLAFYGSGGTLGTGSITLAQYVATDEVFIFRTAVPDTGPLSGRAIAVFPDHHQFFARDGMYRFDGVRALPTHEHVWRDVADRISPARASMINAQFNRPKGELIWTVPLTSDSDTEDGPPETAYVQHYREDTGRIDAQAHSQRDLPALAFGPYQRSTALTWDALSEQWDELNIRWGDASLAAAAPQIIFGDASGNLFVLDASNLQNGTAFESYIRFGLRPTQSQRRKGHVRRIYPFTEYITGDDPDIEVELYGADTPDGQSTLLSSQTHSMDDTGKEFVSPRKVARFVAVQLRTATTYVGYWACLGYQLDVTPAGERGAVSS